MSKTKGQLESAANCDEKRSKYCGWVVVAGLVLEVILAIAFPAHGPESPNWRLALIENAGPVLADILVALGVWGEIFFAGRVRRSEEALRRISNDEVVAAVTSAGKANERAANAELETERLRKELAWRNLSAPQVEKLSEFLAKMPKLCLRIIHAANDPEAVAFSRAIAAAFRANGWRVQFMATVTTDDFAGMMIPLYAPPNLDACVIVRSALAHAGIEFNGGSPPPFSGMMMASGDKLEGSTADICLGSKPPPEISSRASNPPTAPNAMTESGI